MNLAKRSQSSFVVALSLLLLNSTALMQMKADPETKATRIPFEFHQGHIFVDAFVNERGPFRFMVDTGASGVGRADVRLVKELSLPLSETIGNTDGINSGAMATVSIDSLRVGAITRKSVVVGSRDYNAGAPPGMKPVLGFIGRDFFSDHLLTIDYAKSELVIDVGSLQASDPKVVRYEAGFRVPLLLGKQQAVGWLDSGSFMGLVLTLEWAKKLGAKPVRQVGRFRTANTISRLLTSETPLPLEVELAGNKLWVGNAVFAENGDRINIGGAFFSANHCAITFDQKKQLVRLSCASR